MNDAKKTKKQLIEELAAARARIAELEASEAERKRAEEALAKERNLLRTLIDNLPDRIYAKDTKSRFIICNVASAHRMGVNSPDDLVGKTDADFVPPELAAQFHADEQAVIQSGQPMINREEPIDDPSGRMRWNLATKVPLRDSQGKIIGIVGIGREITELKQAEKALEKAYAGMEQQIEERTAELQREIAERKHAQAESQRLQQEVIEAQRRAIQELSTPIIPVMDQVIVMPLIGSIDTLRARDVMRTLLTGIREHRAKVVILDVTGVPIVDSGVANHLNKTIQAARLKGARTIVTGISDAVAETIVDLGIDWSGIETLSDLRTGLIVALDSLGIKLTRQRFLKPARPGES